MSSTRKEYAEWFKELESELAKAGIKYLPGHFYGLIKFYFDNGYSANFTTQVVRLHMSILQQS